MTPSHLKSLKRSICNGKDYIVFKNNCMQCKMTKNFGKEGADFEEINIDEQPEKLITSKA